MIEVVNRLQGNTLEPLPEDLQNAIAEALKLNFEGIEASSQFGLGYSIEVPFNQSSFRAFFCQALPHVLGVKNEELREHLSAVVVGKVVELGSTNKGFEPLYLGLSADVLMGEALRYQNSWVGSTKDILDKHLDRNQLKVASRLSIVCDIPVLEQEVFSSEMKFIQTPDGHNVEIWVTNDPGQLCAEHAKQIIDNSVGTCVLGLPTGRTPASLYKKFVELSNAGWTGLKSMIGVQLDEYAGVSTYNTESFHYFLQKNLFELLPKHFNVTHLSPPTDKAITYDKTIADSGGMLICFLGIGTNGHVAFNEPERSLDVSSVSRRVTLSPHTRLANFGDSEKGYPSAITIGLKSIYASKNICLIANSDNKIAALKAMLRREAGWQSPASLLTSHPGLKLYVTPSVYEGITS